ncbi:hypothetical protein QNM99_21235 [Pseudomonas sp. PCH446]
MATPVSPKVWQQVDVDLIQASEQATVQADDWARSTMEYWRTRIYQQTDEKFIPWFDGYWTQEWLSIKVGWYRLNDQGEQDPSAKRLASYLQEQYRARVLARWRWRSIPIRSWIRRRSFILNRWASN